MMFASTRRRNFASRRASSASTARPSGGANPADVSVFGATVAITSPRLSAEADQATLRGLRHRLRAALCPELLEQVAQMNLHGAFADVERCTDLAVGLAGRHKTQHGHFAECELHARHPRDELGGDRR